MAKAKPPSKQGNARYSLSPYGKFLGAWVAFLSSDSDSSSEKEFCDYMRASFSGENHEKNKDCTRTKEQMNASIIQRVRKINNARTKPKPKYKKDKKGKYILKDGEKVITKAAKPVRKAYPTPFLERENQSLEDAFLEYEDKFAQFMD